MAQFPVGEEDSSHSRKRRFPFDYNPDQFLNIFETIAANDLFTTYNKKHGMGQHLGIEYQFLMCGLYALKCCCDDRILDFRLTSNNNQFQVFDDIALEITWKDSSKTTFLFQLKHGEPQRNLTIGDFVKQNLRNKSSFRNPYCLTRHIDVIKSIKEDNIIYILFTNNTTNLTNELELNFDANKVTVETSPHFVYSNLLVNTHSTNISDIFRLRISEDGDHNFPQLFYLFTNQNNVYTVQQTIEEVLQTMLRCEVYGFVDFIKNWWSGNFVLTKTDILTKLTDLTLSPYIVPLSGENHNLKSKQLVQCIMNFDLTIVEASKDALITTIWEDADKLKSMSLNPSEYELIAFTLHTRMHLPIICLAAFKFGLKSRPGYIEEGNLPFVEAFKLIVSLSQLHISKILWYLDVGPLIVKVNDENKDRVESILKLWETHFKKKKIVLMQDLKIDFSAARTHWKIFFDLTDLSSHKELYFYIISNCHVSLQGRQFTTLQSLLRSNPDIGNVFRVRELVEMTQEVLFIGTAEETLPNLYVPRTLSVPTVETEQLLKSYLDRTDALIIINCENLFVFNYGSFRAMELSEYLNNRSYDNTVNLILLNTGNKCGYNEFEKVCDISGKSVYMFRVFNDKSCILLMKKGDALNLEIEDRVATDVDMTRTFFNSLNYVCGDIGVGKTTLFQFLSKNCSLDFWSVQIDLKTCSFFIKEKPSVEQMLRYILRLDEVDSLVNSFKGLTFSTTLRKEEAVSQFLNETNSLVYRFKTHLVQSKKLMLFFDEIDEIDDVEVVLYFVKGLLQEPAIVWLSTRCHLKQVVEKILNVIPFQIQNLDIKEQRELSFLLNKEQNFLDVIFESVEMAKDLQLLSTPLAMCIISEAVKDILFLRIVPLSTLYQWFFDGLLKYEFNKKCLIPNNKELEYYKTYRFGEYQFVALKQCLREEDLKEIIINTTLTKFSDEEIMTRITNQLFFTLPRLADLLASLWFIARKHKSDPLLDKLYFLDDYENLRMMLDTIFAEESLPHLMIINRQSSRLGEITNSKDREGRSLLHLACSYGNRYPTTCDYERLNRESQSYIKLIERLLTISDISELDNLFKLTCVAYAIRSKCLFPIEKMLDLYKDSVDWKELLKIYDKKTLAFYASQLGYFHVLEALIAIDTNFLNESYGQFSLLEIAILGSKDESYAPPRQGNIQVVKTLLRYIDISRKDAIMAHLLNFATKHQCLDIIQEGILNTDTENTILHIAARDGTLNKKMLEQASDIIEGTNREGQSPIHLACEAGQLNVVKTLLERGASIGVRCNKGRSPLHYAVLGEKNEEIVQFLLKHGADPNVRDNENLSPMDLAKRALRVQYFKLLQNVSPVEKMDTDPIPTLSTFRKRPGTTDLGRTYENLLMANFVLKLIVDGEVVDFTLSCDDPEFSYFDDIVITVKSKTDTNTFAIQVKHSSRNRVITSSALENRNAFFNLSKYFHSFKEIRRPYNCDFILFTNSKFGSPDGRMLEFREQNIMARLRKSVPRHFFNTDKKGACFMFEIVDGERTKDEYNEFFTHFFMYTDQTNLSELLQTTMKRFTSLFSTDRQNFEQFLNFLAKWNQLEGTKEKLNKSYVQCSIALNVMNSYIKSLCFGPVNDKMKLLREVILNFTVTCFDEATYDLIKFLWGDLNIDDIRLVNKIAFKYNLTSSYCFEVGSEIISKVLWIRDKCPLIVSENDSVPKIIELCPKKSFIVLGNCPPMLHLRHQVFHTLADLCKSEMYDYILREFKVMIQTKTIVNLEYFVRLDANFAKCVTPSNLAEMLKDTYPVDSDNVRSLEPYISRSLSRCVILTDYLEKFDSGNTLIVLSGKNKEIKNSPNLRYYGEKLSKETFTEICASNSDFTKIHHLKFTNDDMLEWVQSKGDISDLRPYQVDGYFINEKEFYSTKTHNQVNVITGLPGIGKSQFLLNLRNSLDSLTIILTLQDVSSLFSETMNTKSQDADEIFAKFSTFLVDVKFSGAKPLEKKILKTLIEKHQVVYLWDGFDEIVRETRADTIYLIKTLRSRSLSQWITSRELLEEELDEELGVLSRHLRCFTEEEQMVYIRSRLRAEDMLIDAFTRAKTFLKLPKQDDLLAIPLQLFTLTELVIDNKLPNDIFSVVDLYDHFIKLKYDQYFKKKINIDLGSSALKQVFKIHQQTVLESYEKLAIQILFPNQFLEESLTITEDQVGFLTTNRGDFIHSSYADYFAALFFCRNFRKLPNLAILFDSKYTNVRYFFDMLLADKSALHIAVLYQNAELLKSCGEEAKSKDMGGRNPLHLACSWGRRCPNLPVMTKEETCEINDENDTPVKPEDESYVFILEYLLQKFNPSETDDLFKFTAYSYAKITESLFPKIIILRNKIVPELNDLINILYYSARLGYDEAVSICEKPPFVTTRKNSNSLLHLAIDHFSYLSKILETSVYRNGINYQNRDGDTALHLACRFGNVQVVRLLIENGADHNIGANNNKTPLHEACQNGDFECVKTLIRSGTHINCCTKDQTTPLHLACQGGHLDCVLVLVQSGADVQCANQDGITPLHLACQEKQLECVRLLITCGADTNRADKDGKTPLHFACENGHIECVQFLIASGVSIDCMDRNGITPLYLACQNGHLQCAQILIFKGANVNSIANGGTTPLYLACQQKHLNCVKLLIQSGANVNQHMQNRMTPLHVACQNNDFECMNLLVYSGADVGSVSLNGITPLHLACQNGYIKCVELLLSVGANLNVPASDGNTALHLACQKGFTDIALFLIKNGADINLRNKQNRTPLEVALSLGNDQIVDFLTKLS